MLSHRKAFWCLIGAILSLQQQITVLSTDPLSACPPSADVRCQSGEAVECNSSRFQSCIYDSLCDAQHSHADFNEVTCLRRRLSGACADIHKPVECRKNKESAFETFDNLCVATSDGGYDPKECCNANLKICPTVFNPVECRKDTDDDAKVCSYNNYCDARGAGYQKVDCIFTATHKSLENHVCEVASDEAKAQCKDLGLPMRNLVCGPNKCPMDNVCVAKKMGWNKLQCTKVDGCRLLQHQKIRCDKSYRPVLCSANKKCEFGNLCIAMKGAGYKPDECVSKNVQS